MKRVVLLLAAFLATFAIDRRGIAGFNVRFYLAVIGSLVLGGVTYNLLAASIPGVESNALVAFLVSTGIIALLLAYIMRRFRATPGTV